MMPSATFAEVTFKGNYSGSKSLALNINLVKTSITNLTSGTKYYSAWCTKKSVITK